MNKVYVVDCFFGETMKFHTKRKRTKI